MTWVGVYQAISPLLAPVARSVLRHRLKRGKEDAARLPERMGVPGQARPAGALSWFHAASVGEALSVLPVIEHLTMAGQPVLITTGTVTSAKMMAERLPQGALHQYVPIDVPKWVDQFLDHWQPAAAVWVESEFWPNLMLRTKARGIPMALINARISDTTFAKWQKYPQSARRLLACFTAVTAQSQTDADRVRALYPNGPAPVIKNLKWSAAPLPYDQADLEALQTVVAGRPTWLAASIHPGEEAAVSQVHTGLAHKRLIGGGALTIVVPRHPQKAAEMRAVFEQHGLSVAQRSLNEPMSSATDIYLADTMGELGLFYRMCEVVFIGGSLVPHGGQNPLEAARLDSAVIVGPHMENFPWLSEILTPGQGILYVSSASELSDQVTDLLADSVRRRDLAAAATEATARTTDILEDVVNLIQNLVEATP